jgi:hypothetical protein
MAGSTLPGPTQHDPFSRHAPARTFGPLGVNDAADPNQPSRLGDTPGPLGVNDHAALKANGGRLSMIASDQLRKLGTAEQTDFMRRVFDAQLKRALKKKKFFAGLSSEELDVVEGRHQMRRDAAQSCKLLLAQARSELKQKQQEGDGRAMKVTDIGIASAYRDPQRDKEAWHKTFKKHYALTSTERARLEGGEHGERAVEFMVLKLRKLKAVPGFSNHTSGIAVDFTTTENKVVFTANSSQNEQWKSTWLHQWLVVNANKFHFQPLATETWHWDYND